MKVVYVIEDDPMMADVIALAARSTVIFDETGAETHPGVLVFNDAIEPLSELDQNPPDVILLDVLLSGPDGFSFLNELLSYQDTAKIPVALITALDLPNHNLEHYGVFRILNKTTMTPEDIRDAILAGLDRAAELSSTESTSPVPAVSSSTEPAESASATPSSAGPTSSVSTPDSTGFGTSQLNQQLLQTPPSTDEPPHAL